VICFCLCRVIARALMELECLYLKHFWNSCNCRVVDRIFTQKFQESDIPFMPYRYALSNAICATCLCSLYRTLHVCGTSWKLHGNSGHFPYTSLSTTYIPCIYIIYIHFDIPFWRIASVSIKYRNHAEPTIEPTVPSNMNIRNVARRIVLFRCKYPLRLLKDYI